MSVISTEVFSSSVAELSAQSVEAVLFDLDGTLIDSVPDLAAAVDFMLQRIGKAPAGEVKVSRWIGNGVSALVKRALADSDNGDALHQVTYPNELEDEEYSSAYSIFEFAYAQRLTQATGLYDGVLSVLTDLNAAEIKLGLITNKPRCFTLPLLRALNIQHFFRDVICGDDLEHKKPHPLPVVTALDNLNVCAEQALMVGDSISDVKSAAAAGVKTVAVTYGYNHGVAITDESHEVNADVFIDQLKQLLA
ncbi:MAG: phosphoglycolate phosphatase [Oleispira sp.]|nr:phosphoglycolate phosphatase [Oleispira sp.]